MCNRLQYVWYFWCFKDFWQHNKTPDCDFPDDGGATWWSTRLKFSPLVKTDEHSGWHVPTGNSFCNHANQINLGTPVSQGRTQLVLIKKCPKCPWPGLPAGAKKSPHLCINYRGVSPLQGKRYPHFSMEIEWASTTQSQTRNWKRFFNYVVIDFVCFLWNPPSGLALSGRTSG